ncbi:MAG: sugar ABC transporter permease [Alphaproteobacteria bacterium]|nr:sugar ABC transporter permease [Alphaproteobacteria bacterium]
MANVLDLPARLGALPARRRRPLALRAPWLAPSLFLAPALGTLAVWIYWPLVETFRLSFYEWNLLPMAPQVFVGLENYQRLLELPELRQAAWNTLLYTVGLLPLTVALPLAVALATRDARGRAGAIYRALIFVPMMIAPVVVAVIWRWLLNPEHGVVNAIIRGVGLPAVRFLDDPGLALWSIVFITGWKLVGFSTLIFAAALTSIDRSLIEAARLDGATEGQIARLIYVPLVMPAIVLLGVLTVLHGAQWSFVYINVLTRGGPLQSTTNLYYLLWEYGFSSFAIGWSTAAGMLLFVVFGIAALFGVRLMNRSDARPR